MEDLQRELRGEIELSRRQLETSWSQLRREQQEWRDYRHHEEAALQARHARLEQREAAVRQAAEQLESKHRQDETVRHALARELHGLDRRIRNYRDRLATLRVEAAQAPRVARVRHLPEQQVRDLVARNVKAPPLGFLGDARVNVLALNQQLDRLAAH